MLDLPTPGRPASAMSLAMALSTFLNKIHEAQVSSISAPCVDRECLQRVKNRPDDPETPFPICPEQQDII
jgi:hypothetical protein